MILFQAYQPLLESITQQDLISTGFDKQLWISTEHLTIRIIITPPYQEVALAYVQ
jgi:hypothetical protein